MVITTDLGLRRQYDSGRRCGLLGNRWENRVPGRGETQENGDEA
jgi:hypothetical protein